MIALPTQCLHSAFQMLIRMSGLGKLCGNKINNQTKEIIKTSSRLYLWNRSCFIFGIFVKKIINKLFPRGRKIASKTFHSLFYFITSLFYFSLFCFIVLFHLCFNAPFHHLSTLFFHVVVSLCLFNGHCVVSWFPLRCSFPRFCLSNGFPNALRLNSFPSMKSGSAKSSCPFFETTYDE